MREVHVHNHHNQHDHGFPHMIHVLLTVFTCGAWLPVYACLWLLSALTSR